MTTPKTAAAGAVDLQRLVRRKAGDLGNYKRTKDGWECKTCGHAIMAAQVHHPIWDGPFPCSGSGRVHVEEVPYCPTCEEKPSSSGAPITPNTRIT
jgi:hypothetical protein